MSLHKDKTKSMYITRQKRQKMKSPFPPLRLQNQSVEEVDSTKVLGVIIDKDLSWSDQTKSLVNRLKQKVNQLSKIKHFLDEHSRKLFFYAHIQSLINYASTTWDNTSETNMKFINRLYKRALKLILLKSTSLTLSDYKYLNILPLKFRLAYNKYMHMFNIVHGNTPAKLKSMFTVNEIRHNNNLSFPRPTNNLFKTSLLYSGSTLWNNLPKSLKTINSKYMFKNQLKLELFSNFESQKSFP